MHLGHPSTEQHLCCCSQGGSGGYDIIDQEHATSDENAVWGVPPRGQQSRPSFSPVRLGMVQVLCDLNDGLFQRKCEAVS